MINKFHNKLINIGFSDKESKVYIALLSLGESPVSKIAEESKINRVTCYDILELLSKKNYVTSILKNRIFNFLATDPEIILQNTKQRLGEFQSIIPSLHNIMQISNKPKIRYFDGLEGIKTVYKYTLESKTEILNYSNSIAIREYWPGYDEEYVKKRIEKKIFLRGIIPDDSVGRKVKKEDPYCYREFRTVSQFEFEFTNEINIYDNKLTITSFDKNLFGIIIESDAIAKTQRDIFKMAFAFAKK